MQQNELQEQLFWAEILWFKEFSYDTADGSLKVRCGVGRNDGF